ncbi:MAG: hypothetical protein JWO31_2326 [Phycisphaerales bacterium]|nr:hypothetical protein [Phycisphaerales bacterium]
MTHIPLLRTSPPQRNGLIAERATPRRGARPSWPIWFAIAGFACQVGLYFFGDTLIRLPLRVCMYAFSLALLFILRGPVAGGTTAAIRIVQAIVVVLLISLIHPDGDRLIARLAQAALYVAVLAPLKWTRHIRFDLSNFRKLAIVSWMFYTASATAGVLQVLYPGKFDGALANNYSEAAANALTYVLDDGTRLFRPKGLTDLLGGAGTSGIYAIILGIGMLLTETRASMRCAAALGMIAGLFCIYMSHGRTNIVIVATAIVATLTLLARRGEYQTCARILMIVACVSAVGTATAFTIGGESTIDRWSTLVGAEAPTTFHGYRGMFLEALLTQDIWIYPAGAGMGRWGMMNAYFGTPDKALWAEMMWQSLLYDGGIPLMILYLILASIILHRTWIIGVEGANNLGRWGAVLFGYTAAAIVASFSFPIFSVQLGLEVILFNAALQSAFHSSTQRDQMIRKK